MTCERAYRHREESRLSPRIPTWAGVLTTAEGRWWGPGKEQASVPQRSRKESPWVRSPVGSERPRAEGRAKVSAPRPRRPSMKRGIPALSQRAEGASKVRCVRQARGAITPTARRGAGRGANRARGRCLETNLGVELRGN